MFSSLPRPASLIAAIVLVFAGYLHQLTHIEIVDASLHVGDGPAQPISFPYSAEFPADQILEFAFVIHKGPLTQASIVFVPDDRFMSLSINGHDVPLNALDPKKLEDYRRGFALRIGPHLQRGDNSIVARVLNRGGLAGLDARSDWRDWPNLLELLAASAAFLYIVARALRPLRLTRPIVILFLAGVIVRIAYLSVTPFNVRGNDFAGHLEYIEYLISHGRLPGTYDGWSFYQPPLYYVLGAGTWKAMTLGGIHSRDTVLYVLQLQSMLYQIGFLAFSVATVLLWMDRLPDSGFGRRLASRPALTALLVALLCLWPSGVIHSVRLGNDDLLYLCFGAGLYFASRWWISWLDRDLNAAAVCGALAVVTKSNGVLIFVLLAGLLAGLVVARRVRAIDAISRRLWPTVILCLLSTTATLGRALVDTASGRRFNILIGNAGALNRALDVGNRAENYLWFDAKMFVTEPFTSAWDDAKGRQFFWNYLFKSSLFGEFQFEPDGLSNLAVILSILFLVVLSCLVFGIFLNGDDTWPIDLPAAMTAAILVLSLAALRMCIPAACTGDCRYIFPILIPFLYLYVRSLTLFHERGWTALARGARTAGWSFAALSASFFAVLAAHG